LPKAALAIRHVAFEDLGSFAAPIKAAGYDISYRDAGSFDLTEIAPLAPDLLVILGGPIGAYEDETYPFLKDEIELLKQRLAAGLPTLGLCLGAQLIARALGARVYAGSAKEIGWSPIRLTPAGRATPLRHIEEVAVLHWHGDTFDLPAGCEHLASTAVCTNQAFALGPNLLALQFHPEAQTSSFEHWLIGHACELAAAKIDPRALRSETLRNGAKVEVAASRLASEWLANLA
jgi:GMP synthase (glutamine-hydrolysing)